LSAQLALQHRRNAAFSSLGVGKRRWSISVRIPVLSNSKRRNAMKIRTFSSVAGVAATVAGVFGLLYSISFVVLQNDLLSALFLLLAGLTATAVMTALYRGLKETDASFALLALALSLGAAAGSLIHGGHDLSNALHPPASLNTDLPSPIDPRGLLTFGVAGIGLFLFCWLKSRNAAFPAGLGFLGYFSAALMLVLYLGRLIILQATSPAILIPALVEGFVVNPAWYVWLGFTLLRQA
jgi:hypothetical protein